ncbi:hypothetical protein BJ742DRAFT_833393 [Cladochytrium replicatum]|nr:hypothetical protein BJ742DRAFT_833393 [Cladochytrium replicatum]
MANRAMATRNSSHFRNIAGRLYVHLPPRFASAPMEGVHLYLSRFLMRYVPEVDSIVLAYSNVEPEETSARIMFDSPFLHFYVRAVFTVFRPSIGSLLLGVVNKVSPDHVGLLVHGVFNASIPANQLRPDEFRWDDEEGCWKETSVHGGELKIDTGSVVRFSVADLIRANDMLTVSGTLMKENTGVVDVGTALPPIEKLPAIETQGGDKIEVDGQSPQTEQGEDEWTAIKKPSTSEAKTPMKTENSYAAETETPSRSKKRKERDDDVDGTEAETPTRSKKRKQKEGEVKTTPSDAKRSKVKEEEVVPTAKVEDEEKRGTTKKKKGGRQGEDVEGSKGVVVDKKKKSSTSRDK